MKDAKGHGSDPRGAHAAGVENATRGVVMRNVGERAGTDALNALTQPGHLYRGMSAAEYSATIGSGGGIRSNLSASIASAEGTNFASDAPTAESYANFGRDDPRTTGRPNYLVEVKAGPDITSKPDGYFHSRTEVPAHRITRVWRMANEDGAVVGRRVK